MNNKNTDIMNGMYEYSYIKVFKLKYKFGYLHNQQRWYGYNDIYLYASKIIADNKLPILYSTHKIQLYVCCIETNYIMWNCIPKRRNFIYIK